VNIKTTLKASVAATALLAVAAPVAYAGSVNDGGGNKVVMSGQVVRSLMYADSGPQDEWFQGDGGSAGSRVRWIGTGNVNENVAVKSYFEMDLPHSGDLSSATLILPGGESVTGQSTLNIRHAEIRFSHKQMGSIDFGRGSTASNGKSEADFSGMGPAFSQGAIGSGTGIQFFDTAANAYGGTTRSAGTVLSAFDGRSKGERIRYNLPSMNGLSISASTEPGGGGGNWDVGGSYTAMMGDIKGYAGAQINGTPGTSDGGWSGSIALEHGSGLTMQGHYGTVDSSRATTDPDGWGVLVGYKAKLFAAGPTNLGVQYMTADDVAVDGDDAEVWMVGATQGLGGGVTVHASYRQFELTDTNAATTFDDITQFFVGTVVKF